MGKNRAPQPHGTRVIEVAATSTTIDGWRKHVVAGQPDAGMFSFTSDESEYLPGGEGTSPTPLTYFVAGIAL